MATAKTKTATVAPPPRATVNIKVRFKSNNAPVAGVLGFAARADEAVRNLGKTNALGQLKNVKFELGQVAISIVFQNFRGEGLAQADPNNPNSTLIFTGALAEETRNFDVLMVQVASQVTVTVVDSVSGLPLAGTAVQADAFKGSGDRNGKVVTDGLASGQTHTVTAVLAGFGPESGSVEGPVSSVVDLTHQTTVTNTALTLKMKPIFGKVKSSQITVSGQAFPAFYADFVKGFPPKHPTIIINGQSPPSFPAASQAIFARGAWTKLFDDLPKWAGAPEITLQEFVAIFLIFANETGGAFKPIAEQGKLPYVFYLNKPTNRLAGDQLLARKVISDPKDVTVWNARGRLNKNGTACDNYPGTSSSGPTDADVTECDFNKYRGRGFVQLTLFDIYLRFLEPSLLAAGFAGCEQMTSAELDSAVLNNEQVYYGMLGLYLKTLRDSWGRANSEQWRQFGLSVAGQSNQGYGDLFQFRAENLFKSLSTAARAGQLDLK